MGDVEGQRSQEADEEGDGNPLVACPDGEHLGGDGPRDSEGVELLDLSAGPNVGSFGGFENWRLVVDDADHHHVVEKSTKNATDDLGSEGGFG